MPPTALEKLPLPSWKIPPWAKWIFYPLLLIPLAIPVLFAVSVAFSLLKDDDYYHRAMDYSGDLKVLENDFRLYYHGRANYPVLSLDELAARRILSDNSLRTLKEHRHEFAPFSPQTPDSATVLTVHGTWWQPDRFTKGNLTAEPVVPNAVATAFPPPSASPASTP